MLGQLGRQISAVYGALPTGRKVALALLIVMVLGGLSLMVHIANKPDYQLLFSNISAEDAGVILSKLKEQRIPYKVSGAGKTILVPSEKVDELRLQLASEGLPRGEGSGFEIFDRSSPWSTGFVQELNYQRAMQGELARSIGSLAEVEWARVHIVVPRESLFIEDKEKATASVVLKIRSGRSLNRGQIGGIVHLVAGSVAGLEAENVTLIDSYGNILSARKDQDVAGQLTTTQFEIKQKMELGLQTRLQAMLDKTLGKNHSTVNVNVDMDFRKVERTEERFDPDNTVVRNEQTTSEKSSGGQPALAEGTEQSSGEGQAAGSSYQKKNETMSYEIGKVVNHIVEPVGTIKRLHVAVIIDGKHEKTEDGTIRYIPKTDEEMALFDNLIKKASGFNEERGDQIEIANIRFDSSPAKEPTGEGEGGSMADNFKMLFLMAQKYLLKIVLLLLFFLFMVRPLYKWLLSQQRGVAVREQKTSLPGMIEGEEDFHLELRGQQEGRELPPKERALEIVRADPNKAATIARKWLNEER